MSIEGTGWSARKSLFFQHFCTYFWILSPFHDSFPCQTNKKSVFQVEIKIANTKTNKAMLTECIASVLYPHTGVITGRVEEKSAALHSK